MEYVWVRPAREDEFELPYGARIVERSRGRVRIRDDAGREANVSARDVLRPMHPSCVKDVEDMVMMGDLQEYSILRNLELRYRKNLIYTYTGNVLIAINPYQMLPIYGNNVAAMYRNKKLGEMPPHIFAVGDVSYEDMMLCRRRQCVIINGESGAGKTQSAKFLLNYYAAVTGKSSVVEEQILESNPILEAFGNAKTVRNDNSSRFGKYIALNFNWDGRMEQARIKQFLLEKSRIVVQCKGERNYHVFYMLVKGLSSKEKRLLGLKEVSHYKYLSEDKADAKTSKDEIAQFQKFRQALKTLNFTEKIVWKIFELLAAILHLGNVSYSEVVISGVEAVEVVESKELSLTASLLGVSCQYLKSCLARRTIAISSEKVLKDLNRQEAIDTRDAFVKAVYGNLFNFVVGKINEAVHRDRAHDKGYIGVLDVFGFENFKSNSFEQLCINLANEQLQQFFIHHTFKIEQMQYIEEGIPWRTVDFVDNRAVIDLLCVMPMNVISIINDQSRLTSGTDEALLGKLIEHHGENENFLRPKFNHIRVFGIHHFAGVVLYDVDDFLEKNRDSYSLDFMSLARLSENEFLKRIFADDLSALSQASKKRPQTTCVTKFKNSLDALMVELNECQPFFVRCIKPNDTKKPNAFDRTLCCQQLRYSGLLETSKIRQVGFSVRYTFREFIERYRLLGSGIPHANFLSKVELEEATRVICFQVLKSDLENQFGYSRVFLRNAEYLSLEKEREKALSRYVLILQTGLRRWLARKRYLALRRAAIILQKHWRGRRLRRRYQTTKRGVLRLQAVLHSRHQRKSYLHLRRVVTMFQARCRGYAVRRVVRQKLEVARMERLKAEREASRAASNLQVDPRGPGREKEEPKKSLAPMWMKNFLKGKPVQQESYLHGRGRRVLQPHQIAASKVVDDSFNFLNDHLAPKRRNEKRLRDPKPGKADDG